MTGGQEEMEMQEMMEKQEMTKRQEMTEGQEEMEMQKVTEGQEMMDKQGMMENQEMTEGQEMTESGGDPTTALGSLFQGLAALSVKKFSLIPNQNLPRHRYLKQILTSTWLLSGLALENSAGLFQAAIIVPSKDVPTVQIFTYLGQHEC
ncbi:hypothetical protein HGM15179_001921 [Zosterops borbonicus]|uniref:Uncharacterized protein n=1 Tax=Zosterops borbonicus TaxID=364589 RepID=A0A8K1LSJ6_9PASS|nr:hypothetical protein HGM15179_001921 [Zosterops borbonicus]